MEGKRTQRPRLGAKMLDVYLQKIDLAVSRTRDERLATLLAILYWDRLLPSATADDAKFLHLNRIIRTTAGCRQQQL
jgi:hypothetical protein